MLEFKLVDVQCYNLDYLVVNWSILPTTEDISLYEFSVWRSESPDSDFAMVRGGIVDTFSYKDADVNLYSKWRTFYYKVRCSLISDPTQYVDSASEGSGTKPDATTLEIIRRNDLILGNLPNIKSFVGVPAYVYIRKTWGQRCPECWDAIKQRKVASNCPVCYNTGFVGGFHTPVSTHVNFSPSQKVIRQGGFTEQQVDETFAWMSNHPLVNNKDVIVQDGRLRYRVAAVAPPTQRLGLIVHQTLKLVRINQNDIEYKLQIPGAE